MGWSSVFTVSNGYELCLLRSTYQWGNVQSSVLLELASMFAGSFAANLIDETKRFDVIRNACPGAGACGGMYTANTMASAIEALGMSLPYSSSVPAEDPLKKVECRLAGRQVHFPTWYWRLALCASEWSLHLIVSDDWCLQSRSLLARADHMAVACLLKNSEESGVQISR